MQMSKRYDKYVLLSDLDGTLFSTARTVHPKNRAAIEEFIRLGGHFSISTGRTASNAMPILEGLTVNMPGIFLNGAMVYDTKAKKILSFDAIPRDSAEKIARFTLQNFPRVDVQVYRDDKIIYISPRATADAEWVRIHEPCYFSSLEQELNFPWMKMLFLGEAEDMQKMADAFKANGLESAADFVFSAPQLYEALPVGVNKGKAVRFIRTLYPDKIICAIGDYSNDAEMLKEADIAAVPANAHKDVKPLATFHVCHCDEGAVADFIAMLE